jgi:hypothetical protein
MLSTRSIPRFCHRCHYEGSGYVRLSGERSYEAMARRYLAITGPDDPRSRACFERIRIF